MSRDRFAHHEPAAGHDTAGTPWAGREMSGGAFAADAGAADPRVVAALEALAAATPAPGGAADAASQGASGAATDAATGAHDDAEAALVTALGAGRVLVPVVAAPASGEGPDGADMASLVLTAPDGRRGLPVFSGLDALTAWRPDARPVPVATPDAARAAIDDRCDVLLLDLGTERAAVLRLSQLWALAQGRAWTPAHADPLVRAAVEGLPAVDPRVLAARAESGAVHAPGVVRLVLTLAPGLPEDEVRRLATAVGERLAADPEVRSRIDDLALVVRGPAS